MSPGLYRSVPIWWSSVVVGACCDWARYFLFAGTCLVIVKKSGLQIK